MMTRGDWLLTWCGLAACAALILIIDWRGMYEVFQRSIEYQIYRR